MRKRGSKRLSDLLIRERATLAPKQSGIEIQSCLVKHLFGIISSFIHQADISVVESVCQWVLFTGDVGVSE